MKVLIRHLHRIDYVKYPRWKDDTRERFRCRHIVRASNPRWALYKDRDFDAFIERNQWAKDYRLRFATLLVRIDGETRYANGVTFNEHLPKFCTVDTAHSGLDGPSLASWIWAGATGLHYHDSTRKLIKAGIIQGWKDLLND